MQPDYPQPVVCVGGPNDGETHLARSTTFTLPSHRPEPSFRPLWPAPLIAQVTYSHYIVAALHFSEHDCLWYAHYARTTPREAFEHLLTAHAHRTAKSLLATLSARVAPTHGR